MKNRSLALSALMAASLFSAGQSFAEPTEATPPPFRQVQSPQQANRGELRYRAQPNRGESQNAYEERRRNEPGAGPDHRFHRGDRLPPEYRGRQYVVDDWRGHRLSAPPRGYHWVQSGGDYLLVAVATGVIAELLLNH